MGLLENKVFFVKCILSSDVWRSQVPKSETFLTYASAVKHVKS
jgi:hypothetical protein